MGLINCRLNTFACQLKNSTASVGMLHAFYVVDVHFPDRDNEDDCGRTPVKRLLLHSIGWTIKNALPIATTYYPRFMKEK